MSCGALVLHSLALIAHATFLVPSQAAANLCQKRRSGRGEEEEPGGGATAVHGESLLVGLLAEQCRPAHPGEIFGVSHVWFSCTRSKV